MRDSWRHNDLQEEINRRLQAVEAEEMADLYRLSSEIQMSIINSEVPEDLAAEINAAYRRLAETGGPGGPGVPALQRHWRG